MIICPYYFVSALLLFVIITSGQNPISGQNNFGSLLGHQVQQSPYGVNLQPQNSPYPGNRGSLGGYPQSQPGLGQQMPTQAAPSIPQSPQYSPPLNRRQSLDLPTGNANGNNNPIGGLQSPPINRLGNNGQLPLVNRAPLGLQEDMPLSPLHQNIPGHRIGLPPGHPLHHPRGGSLPGGSLPRGSSLPGAVLHRQRQPHSNKNFPTHPNYDYDFLQAMRKRGFLDAGDEPTPGVSPSKTTSPQQDGTLLPDAKQGLPALPGSDSTRTGLPNVDDTVPVDIPTPRDELAPEVSPSKTTSPQQDGTLLPDAKQGLPPLPGSDSIRTGLPNVDDTVPVDIPTPRDEPTPEVSPSKTTSPQEDGTLLPDAKQGLPSLPGSDSIRTGLPNVDDTVPVAIPTPSDTKALKVLETAAPIISPATDDSPDSDMLCDEDTPEIRLPEIPPVANSSPDSHISGKEDELGITVPKIPPVTSDGSDVKDLTSKLPDSIQDTDLDLECPIDDTDLLSADTADKTLDLVGNVAGALPTTGGNGDDGNPDDIDGNPDDTDGNPDDIDDTVDDSAGVDDDVDPTKLLKKKDSLSAGDDEDDTPEDEESPFYIPWFVPDDSDFNDEYK